MPVPNPLHHALAHAGAFSRRAALISGGAGAAALAANSALGQATPSATPLGTPSATPQASPVAATADPVTSSLPQVFKYENFQFDFLGLLGAIYERGADAGEIFAAAHLVEDGNFDSWFATWMALGDRINAIGANSDAAGHRQSAAEAFLRASSYYSVAQTYSLGTSDPSQWHAAWETSRDAFDAFITRIDNPVEMVEIPYEDTTLPGYVVLQDDSGEPRPWLIANNGSDGQMSNMWVMAAAPALRRGYNVLLFDGPGQGAALFRQQLYFRYDWEAVITPVVDFLFERPDVDQSRVGILGVSQAGYWVPRALAFEHRIAAAVIDPGVYDVMTSWTTDLPADALDGLLHTTGEEQAAIRKDIDASVAQVMENPYAKYTLEWRMYPFGKSSFSDTLLLLQDYNLEGVIEQVTTPLLISAPDGESFWPGQSQEVYDHATGDKVLVPFLTADGADLHCEPKANALRGQVFFDWMDEVFGREVTE